MKDIKNYEGLYAITSCGKIYSYKRKVFLKPEKVWDGYLRVFLYKDGIGKHYKVHRLVAETYIPNPENKPCVNHIDECKTNNALQNLEWVTHKENNNFGTHNERSGKSRRKKIQCVETNEIFNSVTETAKAVNIGLSSISSCLTGKYKTAAGLHWKYYD